VRWPRRRPALDAALAARIQAWQALPEPDARRGAGEGRWVVADVETSGLDPRRDRLISVGALAVIDGAVDLADSFEVVLRQALPSEAVNIEVHGIGGTEQMTGCAPAEALVGFLEFAGKAPLVGYNAFFDAAVLERAFDEVLGLRWRRPWLDLADVAPLAWPKKAAAARGLDGWLEAFGIPIVQRHRAIVDCLATAQLFTALLPRAPTLGAPTAGRLLALSGQSRWLGH
jgi:DNA polymerase-3 subunit epsilon